MRKNIVGTIARGVPVAEAPWIDIERHAEVDVSSEEASHPVESAFRHGDAEYWRAAEPGAQTLRLRFDDPRHIRRIRLVFTERASARTQEFLLSWSRDNGATYRDVVRQQYTFSPPGTVREAEDYRVQLEDVTTLELHIVPDISGGMARASLTEWAIE